MKRKTGYEGEDPIHFLGAGPYSLFDPRWFALGISVYGARGFWLRMAVTAVVVSIGLWAFAAWAI